MNTTSDLALVSMSIVNLCWTFKIQQGSKIMLAKTSRKILKILREKY